MKINSNVRFQSRWFALFVTACLLFQAGFAATPALASQQTTMSIDAGQASVASSSFSGCAAVVGMTTAECDALLTLYNSANGVNWSFYNSAPWLQSNAPCSWDGVYCSGGHVTQLNLQSRNLFGMLPTELGSLTYLISLDLSYNYNLTGSIPASLGSLTNLQGLYLYNNQLSGSVPTSLGSLTNLQYLYLYNNQLSGSIPTELGNLTNLYSLYLNDNQLSGSIPASLGSLTNLQNLNLSSNQLSGSIPTELGNLTNLYSLFLNNNQLSGAIPASLGSLANLQYLNLSSNQLSGNIPSSLGSLTNLRELYLLNNQLSSAFPSTFTAANLPSLTTLTFDCWITSSDPSVISFITTFAGAGWELATCAPFTSCAAVTEIPATECDALAALYASADGAGSWRNRYNWLNVNRPCFWFGVTCNAGHVTQLNLYYNNLHGALPAALGSLPYLESLNLRGNYFTGSIPPELGNLTKLRYLNLSYAGLSGAIPSQLGNLAQLRFLRLYGNFLSGGIPAELGNLANLYILDLSENQLSGGIPASLGTLAQLRYLYLYSNVLTGGLPELGGLTSLVELDVSFNRLSGEVPTSITNLAPASVAGSADAPNLPAQLKHGDEFEFMPADADLSAQSGGLRSLYLSCGLTSSNPAVIAFVEKLSPGWMNDLCVTTITTDTPDPSRTGEEVIVSVTVGGGKATRTGTVHIRGADTNCDFTLFNGAGSCKVVFNTKGAKTLTASYVSTTFFFGYEDYNYLVSEGSEDTEAHSTKATPVITWSAPADIISGAVLGAAQLNATADVPGTFVYTPAAGAILSLGTHTLHVDFTPTDATQYTTASKDVSVTVVDKIAPILTWNNPADIISGSALSATQLNAVADVPGTFVYTPVAGTILSLGTHTLHVDFTPTDATQYTTASKDVSVTVVDKIAPILTWNNPADIISGSALSAIQLNAAADVPGIFVYTPAIGTTLRLGMHTLHVDFTPTDAAKYKNASKDVVINVVAIERITNGGFNIYAGKSNIPYYWMQSKFMKTDGQTLDYIREGDASIKIAESAISYIKSLKQTLALSGMAEDAFTLSYWVKGKSLPAKGSCKVQVELYNATVVAGTYILPCTSGTFDWKQRILKFTTPVAYTSVVVKIVFNKANSTVWFDGVSLIK